MRYLVDYVGVVAIPTPAPLPPPAPPLVLLSEIKPDGLGGVSFVVPAAPGTFPVAVRALWLPPDFDQNSAAEDVFDAEAPSVDLDVVEPGPLKASPPEGVPPGRWLLALVSVYED